MSIIALPSVPSDFLIADPALGDAQDDASLFLRDNATLLSQSTVDNVKTKFQTFLAIYNSIPGWMMMPLFVFCMVVFVVLAIPLIFVFEKLVRDPPTLMRLASLASLGWIVAVIALFV